jgi:hypothetical protein
VSREGRYRPGRLITLYEIGPARRRLKAENERLKSQRGRNSSLKVIEKGRLYFTGSADSP